MKLFNCDICGTRLNRGDDCFVKIGAFSKRVDDGWHDKNLDVHEGYEICPECWESFKNVAKAELERLSAK